MKRLIGYTAVLCLLALLAWTVGCGGAIHSGALAYISNSAGTGFTVYNVDTNGTLSLSNISPQDAPASPKVLQISPNGKWAFFLDAAGQNVYAYTRAGNGTLQVQIGVYPLNAPGTSLVISPNNLFLYVAQAGTTPQVNQLLSTYSIDQATGILTQVGQSQLLSYYISQLLMAPNGGVLYGLSPQGAAGSGKNAAVLSWTLSSTLGTASLANTLPVGQSPDWMILSANGSFLYVLDATAISSYTNVACLAACPPTAAYTMSPVFYAYATSSSGVGPTNLIGTFNENADLVTQQFPRGPIGGATSNDSRFLFIVNQNSANISAFRIGAINGEPTEVLGALSNVNNVPTSNASPFPCNTTSTNSCTAPAFLAVAPGNNALYVLDPTPGLVLPIFQFSIDQNTGRLRAFSTASVAAESSTSVPSWITIH